MKPTRKISYHTIKAEKHLMRVFYVWLLLSLGLAIGFHYQFLHIQNIDVPTHFFAGVFIAGFIFAFWETHSTRRAFLWALVPFLLWELIELTIAYFSAPDAYRYRLFHETWRNRIRDVIMDSLGFVAFVLSKKYFGRKPNPLKIHKRA